MRYVAACVMGMGATCLLLWALRALAARIGLIDRPAAPKLHATDAALVGGIAMFAGAALSLLLFAPPLRGLLSFLAASALLVVVGAMDDHRPLRARARFAAQIGAALIMALAGGVVIDSLGAIGGEGRVTLGIWALPFTVFATVGLINALNMADGVDGLAGGLAFLAFLVLAAVAAAAGRFTDAFTLAVLASVVATFLAFNLRLPGRRKMPVFMGDAGSMFLGFALAWFAISLSQGEGRAMTPVTALWILALPVIDTVSVMVRRLTAGRSMFASDQRHLHYMLLRAGCSVNATVAVSLSAALLLALVGIFGLLGGVAEQLMFYCFLGLSLLYLWGVMRLQDAGAKAARRAEDLRFDAEHWS